MAAARDRSAAGARLRRRTGANCTDAALTVCVDSRLQAAGAPRLVLFCSTIAGALAPTGAAIDCSHPCEAIDVARRPLRRHQPLPKPSRPLAAARLTRRALLRFNCLLPKYQQTSSSRAQTDSSLCPSKTIPRRNVADGLAGSQDVCDHQALLGECRVERVAGRQHPRRPSGRSTPAVEPPRQLMLFAAEQVCLALILEAAQADLPCFVTRTTYKPWPSTRPTSPPPTSRQKKQQCVRERCKPTNMPSRCQPALTPAHPRD